MKEMALVAVQLPFLDNGHHQRISECPKDRFSAVLGFSKRYDVIYHNSYVYITIKFCLPKRKAESLAKKLNQSLDDWQSK
ncbi:MAG: hypothetical protein PT118_11395 [Aphanizomenon gracile PMC644.10]|jgi:hypothetical protein|nr:hypothetical protein [Aphanizomenon gracile PMC638.10]MDM3860424.1 hypothetical protein [Aphanizomenon gracile PMC644.10]